MYGVDPEALIKALTKPRVRVGNEWVNKGQNMDQVVHVFTYLYAIKTNILKY